MIPVAIGLAVLAPQAAAVAAAPPASVVRGRLAGRAGTTVLAMRPNGVSKSVRLNATGSFSFQLPTAEMHDASLQLVDKSGRYAGPVVLRAGAGRAYTALGGASVDLGVLSMRAGHARVLRALPNAAVDVQKFARADAAGKPVGAGKLGMVRTPTARTRTVAALATTRALAAGSAATGAGDDPDGDGVPNTFDADDNGNGTLDGTDPASARNAGSNAGLFSTLYLPFDQALNVNAASVTQAQIDAVFAGQNNFGMVFYFDDNRFRGETVTGVDVDCFAAVYCARGTGTAAISGLSESSAALPRETPWVNYNTDGSGLPNLENMQPHVWAMGMQPRVPTASIHPGDTYAVNFRMAGGTVVTVPTSLSSYFVTTPAIKSWTDGTTSTDISYPVTDSAAGVLAAPTGSIGLTYWRPQRAAIAGSGEAGSFVDMGKLHYGITTSMPGVPGEIGCGGFYSAPSAGLVDDYVAGTTDPSKKLYSLRDTSSDAAPDASRTLSFTLDLAGCLRAAGADPTGQRVNVTLGAASEGRPGGMDRAAQSFSVQF